MIDFEMPLTIDTPHGELEVEAACEVHEPTGSVTITHLRWWGKWFTRLSLAVLADQEEWERCRRHAQLYWRDHEAEIMADLEAAEADYRYDLRAAE